MEFGTVNGIAWLVVNDVVRCPVCFNPVLHGAYGTRVECDGCGHFVHYSCTTRDVRVAGQSALLQIQCFNCARTD